MFTFFSIGKHCWRKQQLAEGFKDAAVSCYLCCWFIGHWGLFLVKCKVYRKVNAVAEYIYSKHFWWFSLQFLICGSLTVQMCSMEVWNCPSTWPESSAVTNPSAALHWEQYASCHFCDPSWQGMSYLYLADGAEPQRGSVGDSSWGQSQLHDCRAQYMRLDTSAKSELDSSHKDTQEQVTLP